MGGEQLEQGFAPRPPPRPEARERATRWRAGGACIFTSRPRRPPDFGLSHDPNSARAERACAWARARPTASASAAEHAAACFSACACRAGKTRAPPRDAITGRAATRTASNRDSTRWWSARAVSGLKAAPASCRSASTLQRGVRRRRGLDRRVERGRRVHVREEAQQHHRRRPARLAQAGDERLRRVPEAAHDEAAQEGRPRPVALLGQEVHEVVRASRPGRRRGAPAGRPAAPRGRAAAPSPGPRASSCRGRSRGTRRPPRVSAASAWRTMRPSSATWSTRCSTSRNSRTSRAKPSTAVEVRAPGRVQQLGHRPHRLPRHGLLGLLRAQPLQQLRPHRPVPQGDGLREGRQRQVPLRRGLVALGWRRGAGRRSEAPRTPLRGRSPRWR